MEGDYRGINGRLWNFPSVKPLADAPVHSEGVDLAVRRRFLQLQGNRLNLYRSGWQFR